jgi:ArsR family transcriptional regulator, arsenate/arsenite/antimonite-responsive transcriptional repressor
MKDIERHQVPIYRSRGAGCGDSSGEKLDRTAGSWHNYHMAMKPIIQQSRRRYEARARIAKALAHPTRLLMLDALQQREMCVCELTELVGADQSTVSKHLAVLKQAGIVEDRREGMMTFYRIKVCCLEGFWQCIESVLKENLKAQREAMEA